MIKVIVSLLVAASLFGSAKVEPKWMISKYECKVDDSTYSLNVISNNIVIMGNKAFIKANDEYNIFETVGDDGDMVAIGLLNGVKLRFMSKHGSFDINCKEVKK